MNQDKIDIYKDQELLDLTQRMAMLSQEEVEFFLSGVEVTSKGRTREEVAQDMIAVYEETSTHLKSRYPDNTVAAIWIGTNQFSANLLRERISDLTHKP